MVSGIDGVMEWRNVLELHDLNVKVRLFLEERWFDGIY